MVMTGLYGADEAGFLPVGWSPCLQQDTGRGEVTVNLGARHRHRNA
jgi:hypothetical protein